MALLSCMIFLRFHENCTSLSTPREVIQYIGEKPKKVWPTLKRYSNNINSICLEYDDVLVSMRFAKLQFEVTKDFVAEDFLASVLDEPLAETCFSIGSEIQNPTIHNSTFLDKLSKTRGFTVKEILEYFGAETERVEIKNDYWITWSDKCFRYKIDEESLGEGFEGQSTNSIINLTKDNKIITLSICTVERKSD